MPKVTKYPRLRTHVRKGRAGQVYTYWFYDMRPDGKADIPLGSDYAVAIEKWRELHEHKPRTIGRLQEAFDRWRRDELPEYTDRETKRNYTRHLARIEGVFGTMTWDEVTLPILVEYLSRRMVKKRKGDTSPPKRATVQGNRELAVLSIVWGKARLWGLTRLHWPAEGVKNWKNPENARLFEVTDTLFNAVYAEGDQVLRDCMDISSATGMRLTDARTVLLPASDMLRLSARKTGKDADFDLSLSEVLPELIERRRAVHATHLMLLSTPGGNPVTPRMLRTRYDDARAAAAKKAEKTGNPGLAVSIRAMILRDMRKRAADLSEDIESASKLLQHSSTKLTADHYRTRATRLKPVR